MNTYYIPMDHDIPHVETTRYERKIIFQYEICLFFYVVIIIGMLKYYQWSPFILLFMALCFYFPRMLWRSLNNRSGLDIESLVKEALKQEQKADSDAERNKTVAYITNSIRVYVENRYNSPSPYNQESKNPTKFWYRLTFWRHRHLSSYIVLLFTFVKFLFLVNSLVQIFLLNSFLGNDYHLFGFEVIDKFVRGLDWGESKRFPRVTLCDFHIREIGIVHRYTVQCVLPINLFNEKIFLILWFWILILVAFNLGDFISWLLRIIRVGSRTAYVRRKLAMKRAADKSIDYSNRDDGDLSEQFVHDYLQGDGCFALRLLARNGQDIIVGEVIDQLYKHYRAEYNKAHTNTDRSITTNNFSSPRSQPLQTLNHNDERQYLVS